jgi:hypothetical protein
MMSPYQKRNLALAAGWIVAVILAILLGLCVAHGQEPPAQYGHDGPALLPDAKYSPGDAARTDKAQLCPVAHTSARRNVTAQEKKAVCMEYGISAAKCTGRNYEIDHIISLELGGSNDVKNLFPQPWMPRPGAHEKDKVENWLHAQVCSDKITLHAAQAFIAKDWYRLYLKMQQEQGRQK